MPVFLHRCKAQIVGMHSASQLHVVLGAGQIGGRVAARLVAQGQRVRQVHTGRAAVSRPGVEVMAGDITDLEFAEAATRGAAVVYDCMNPPYHKWPELLLKIGRGSLHGATRAGARLVALDCLYMYGRPEGAMREDSPLRPCSRKGALRVALAELRLAAHRRGDVAVAIGRASDFFGVDLPYSAWSDRFYRRVLAGKPAECMGDPDMLHAYTYVEDIADALVVLGARDEAVGRVWHLPTVAAESTRALTRRLGAALGRDAKVTRVPRWLLRGLGLFSPFMREMVEMTYQWEVPYVIDDAAFRATFGVTPTPVERQVERTAAWARERYGLA